MSSAKQVSELSKWIQDDVSFETLAVHGGTIPDSETGAVLTPLYLSTTFVQPSVEAYLSKGFSYTRQANPTVQSLEHRIASLEGGKYCVCVSSGMAATTTIFSAFLKPGDHCILPDCSYGGTNRCARLHFASFGIKFSFVDMRDLSQIEKVIDPGKTKMIFTETTCNPTLFLTDIAGVSKMCQKYQILHVCDSTFSTPYLTRPLMLGADITLQSTTKYYDGHNVTVGGALIVQTQQHFDLLSLQRNILGNIMTPFVAFHLLQTVKTLPIRVKQQSESAMKVAVALSQHPKVLHVSYPGLKTHIQHDLACKQYERGLFGTMVSFEVAGGSEAGVRLMNSVERPWTLCENLGASESIITCPAVFTHANMLKEDRLKVGITDGLVRLSIGLEDPQDLLKALIKALDKL